MIHTSLQINTKGPVGGHCLSSENLKIAQSHTLLVHIQTHTHVKSDSHSHPHTSTQISPLTPKITHSHPTLHTEQAPDCKPDTTRSSSTFPHTSQGPSGRASVWVGVRGSWLAPWEEVATGPRGPSRGLLCASRLWVRPSTRAQSWTLTPSPRPWGAATWPQSQENSPYFSPTGLSALPASGGAKGPGGGHCLSSEGLDAQ